MNKYAWSFPAGKQILWALPGLLIMLMLDCYFLEDFGAFYTMWNIDETQVSISSFQPIFAKAYWAFLLIAFTLYFLLRNFFEQRGGFSEDFAKLLFGFFFSGMMLLIFMLILNITAGTLIGIMLGIIVEVMAFTIQEKPKLD